MAVADFLDNPDDYIAEQSINYQRENCRNLDHERTQKLSQRPNEVTSNDIHNI
jgi:hypothetical protein